MNPQVRETEQAQIAGPRTTPETTEVNAVYIAKPVVEIKAPAPEVKRGARPKHVGQAASASRSIEQPPLSFISYP